MEVLAILKHTNGGMLCAYCGISPATDLDHFRAIVLNKMPSKFITDIYNLVPSCGSCNQSKGGKDWKEWIQGKAKKSPNNRKEVKNLKNIINNLEEFEKWSNQKVKRLSDDFINSVDFKNYMKSCEDLISSFEKYQSEANKLQQKAIENLKIGF